MIKLENVNKIFRTEEMETAALSNINLQIKKNEFVAIMGPSGCGKSTLLNVMGTLDNITSGDIYIDDVNVALLKEKEVAKFRNKKMGFIFQSFNLISAFNIRDNVELPLLYRGDISAAERKEKVEYAISKVGLLNRINHFPSQLSGGQCQRAAIARAIVGMPEIIFADEPTGNLDSKMGREILDLLISLNSNDEVTIVMVTHDESIASKTQRIIRIEDGKVVKS